MKFIQIYIFLNASTKFICDKLSLKACLYKINDGLLLCNACICFAVVA